MNSFLHLTSAISLLTSYFFPLLSSLYHLPSICQSSIPSAFEENQWQASEVEACHMLCKTCTNSSVSTTVITYSESLYCSYILSMSDRSFIANAF